MIFCSHTFLFYSPFAQLEWNGIDRLYEVVEFLGEGSMGSVAKVRKRDTAIGGSARSEFVDNEKCCFHLVSMFRLPQSNNSKFEDFSRHNGSSGTVTPLSASNHSISKPKNKKVLQHKPSSLISYKSSNKTVTYALKSLHLDRCTSVALKEELKNEGKMNVGENIRVSNRSID
jgi:hypothetical protein